ncbi:MAG: DNA gyrase subunit A [Candidatus Micrarchaeia archaeon]|jgi:DNA gyrase subunit A
MEKINQTQLEEELQKSYLDYAMSVIIGRAIPDARDGLKPAQRRILYAMYNINNLHNQPTKKSARVVGEVIGKYHPHGDIAVYDTLVRLAQDFTMNHVLVEGQGNFGSIDGDPPAAMRYTEVRLTSLAEEMLADLDKDTVEFAPNFDNTEKEPLTLPSKVPNLLVNGASGIAVGVATSILPHNLVEVCDAIVYVLEHQEVTVDDLLKIIKGPDFPTGGIAVMSANAYNGYRYGRGQITIKAKAKIDEKSKKIVIEEIPYNVNKAELVKNIVELVREKKITGISDVRDESGKDGVHIVIELKNGENGESVLNSLYKHTQLEVTLPIINLAVVGKSLRNFNLLQLIETFINYRREIIRKRTTYELNKASERVHILDGLIIAISKIDDVVKLIRGSSSVAEAKAGLMSSFSLSEKQANAILEMKLARLTSLEYDSISKERSNLLEKIKYYNEVLADPKKVDNIIIEETKELKEKYGRPRRTEIIEVEGEELELKEEDFISNERVTIIYTNLGYIKRLGLSYYKEQARGGKGIIAINLKEGDYTKQILTCNTKDYLLCISDKGRAYWLKAYKIPEGNRYSEGKNIVNMLNLQNEKIIMLFPLKSIENANIVLLTRKGLVKKMSAKLFARPRSTGVLAIRLREGDAVVDAISYASEKYLFIMSRLGKSIKFEESQLRQIGRGAFGVRGMRLSNGDEAKNVIAAGDIGYILTVTENGYGKLTEVSKYRLQRRGGMGVINIKVTEKTGPVAKSIFLSGEAEVLLINSKGIAISFDAASIRITGRNASGVRLMKLDEGAKVVDALVLQQ